MHGMVVNKYYTQPQNVKYYSCAPMTGLASVIPPTTKYVDNLTRLLSEKTTDKQLELVHETYKDFFEYAITSQIPFDLHKPWFLDLKLANNQFNCSWQTLLHDKYLYKTKKSTHADEDNIYIVNSENIKTTLDISPDNGIYLSKIIDCLIDNGYKSITIFDLSCSSFYERNKQRRITSKRSILNPLIK